MPCAITVKGLPFVKPPWGRITAIDLNKGEIVWQIPHGETIDAVKNNKVIAVDDDIASRWGPRIVDFVMAVSKALSGK